MRRKVIVLCLALFLGIFNFNTNVFALDLKNNGSDIKFEMCTLSDEYIKWEQLSDEEKSKTIMPPMCSFEESVNDNVSLMDLFNVTSLALPSIYDGREETFAAKVKNQNPTGECWAFSTTSALEYHIGKKYEYDYIFSPRHIEYGSTREFLNNQINEYGYNRELGSGGNFFMSSSYLANGVGPVLEEEMPFSASEDLIDISEIQNKNIMLDVNDIILEPGSSYGEACTTNEVKQIKEYVYTYGSIMITTYMTLSSNYYNSTTAAFYYNGSEDINHAVLIVGWDDTYSKDNFSSINKPTSDGAWIVQNSYGETFGDSGYYYISYEDVHVCDLYMAIADSDTEIEDNKYIYDKLGYGTFFGFRDSNNSENRYKTAYAMNVFTKKNNKSEILKEVTFGSSGTGTYNIYYVVGSGKDKTVSDMMLIGSGNLDYSGYITHKLSHPIYIDSSVTEFSIVVYYNMDTSVTPLPISISSLTDYQYITLESNKSFVSYSGDYWEDLKDMNTSTLIASVKGFSDNTNYSIMLGNTQVSLDSSGFNVDINYTYQNIDYDKFDLVVKDNLGTAVYTTSTSFDNNKMRLTLNSGIERTTYTVTVYYDGAYIGEKEFMITGGISSNVYTIDYASSVIYVQPNTPINSFITNVKGINDTYVTDGSISYEGNVYTGLKVDGYTVVVFGDVNGDGYARMNDVMKISQYIVDGVGLADYYKLAADVNGDTAIKMNDVMKISNYIVEGGKI